MSAGHYYRFYGLTALSDFALEEAEPCATAEPDLRILAADLSHLRRPFAGFRDFAILPDGDLFAFAGVGLFLVRGPAEIAVDCDPGFDPRLLALPLLGPVIAMLLHRRGHLVLHGSAVAIDGEAAVFLGDKGAGKSTTAASLVAAGFPLIADDVVAIDLTGGLPEVPAGYQAMKLDAPMQARFAPGSGHAIEPEHGLFTAGKIRFRLHRPNLPAPLPLGRLHVLARGAGNALRPHQRAEALRALLRYSYVPRLGPAALAEGGAQAIFAQAAALAPLVRACTLTVRNDLAALADLPAFLQRAETRDHAFV